MKTLRWSLDEKNRPIKDENGQFWGRRKAEAEASRRKRVASWQKCETNPINKDQANYWREYDCFFVVSPEGDTPMHMYCIINPDNIKKDCLAFWNKKSARFFVENANRGGITLKDAIKQARIEYGWDEPERQRSLDEIIAEFKKSSDPITQEQIDAVRTHHEFNKIPYRPFYTFYDSDGDRIYSEDPKQMFISRTLIAPSAVNIERGQAFWTEEAASAAREKELEDRKKQENKEPVKWIERKEGERVRIRYLNPAWVEWSRKNEEKQTESNQTPVPEPGPAEKPPLPDFKNEDEEREFWATHSSVEYLDWSKAVKVKFPDLKKTPEQPEKESVTALLRAEIEKRSIRIDEMRKALDEAIQGVQAIELTIQLVEEEK